MVFSYIRYLVPFGITILSSMVTWIYIYAKNYRLKTNTTHNVLRERFIRREMKMTVTLSLVCIMQCLSMAPTIIFHVLPLDVDQRAALVLEGIFMVQFGSNFFIYVLKNQQYRQAYIFYAKSVCHISPWQQQH